MKSGSVRTPQRRAEVIADLDSLVADPVAFVFRGKDHLIKPVTTEEFLRYVNASSRIMDVIKDPTVGPEEVLQSAHELISSVCDSITLEDVKSMTQAQIVALMTVVINFVTGKMGSDQKKKILTNRSPDLHIGSKLLQ